MACADMHVKSCSILDQGGGEGGGVSSTQRRIAYAGRVTLHMQDDFHTQYKTGINFRKCAFYMHAKRYVHMHRVYPQSLILTASYLCCTPRTLDMHREHPQGSTTQNFSFDISTQKAAISVADARRALPPTTHPAKFQCHMQCKMEQYLYAPDYCMHVRRLLM